jgi:hypothetical protein
MVFQQYRPVADGRGVLKAVIALRESGRLTISDLVLLSKE